MPARRRGGRCRGPPRHRPGDRGQVPHRPRHPRRRRHPPGGRYVVGGRVRRPPARRVRRLPRAPAGDAAARGPPYPDWDQEEAAERGRYRGVDPGAVADELSTAAGDLLRDAASVSEAELARTGRRSDGFQFTVGTLLQYFFHELFHHWWDVS